MNPIARSSNRAIDILQAVAGRMKSGIHRINTTSINLMTLFMDDIIKMFIDSNGIESVDPIVYILKSKKKELYM